MPAGSLPYRPGHAHGSMSYAKPSECDGGREYSLTCPAEDWRLSVFGCHVLALIP